MQLVPTAPSGAPFGLRAQREHYTAIRNRLRGIPPPFAQVVIPVVVPDEIADPVIAAPRRKAPAPKPPLSFYFEIQYQPGSLIRARLMQPVWQTNVLAGPTTRLRIEHIQRLVADRHQISRADMLAAVRTLKVVLPRHIAMYLAKRMTGKSLPEIGRRFGNRDHTTVLHALRKIDAAVKTDDKLRRHIADLISALRCKYVLPVEPDDGGLSEQLLRGA